LDLSVVTVDKIIRSVDGLKTLSCRYTNIKTIPDSLSQAKLLKCLNISHNAIVELGSKPLVLSNLEQFDISFNMLSVISNGVMQWPALRCLDCSHNNIQNVDDDMFCSLPSLRVLNLSVNSIEHLPSSLFSLQHLQELDLESNKISFFGADACVTGLGSLQILRIGINKLQYIAPKLFSHTKLNLLTMEDNPLTLHALRQIPEYEVWAERQKNSINKQIHSGLVVQLN
jgi:Leucine-rich repeat (LRR) protein